MYTRIHTNRGVTLIELMISMVISLLLLAGALYINQSQSEMAALQTNNARLTQHMRELMERMSTDVRRAGYIGYLNQVSTSTISVDNPFSNNNAAMYSGMITDVTISNQTTPSTEAGNSCITYAYNLDDDYPARVGAGTTSLSADFDGDNLEMFGFKLSGGTLLMRTGVGATTNFNCDDGDWSEISDPGLVTLTGLTFSLASTSCTNTSNAARNDCFGATGDVSDDPDSGDVIVVNREVEITLQGVSVQENELSLRLEQTVSLLNDQVYMEP